MAVFSGPEIVNSGLVLHLDAANSKSYQTYNLATYSQDFSNAAWSKSTGLITATNLLAPDGTSTATTLTDSDAAGYSAFSRGFTVPNDSASYNVSIYIKKTTGGTSSRTGFNASFTTGGTAKYYNIRFNADTGVATGGDTNLVTSENNNYWRLSFTISNNGTGNTAMSISYYPATGVYNGSDISSATGSHTVWGMQVTRGALVLPYKKTVDESANSLLSISGFGNNGTLTNGPVYDSTSNGNFSFDGTDRYIIGTLASPAVGSSITIESVVKLNNVSGTKAIFSHGRSAVSFACGMMIVNTNLRFRNSSNNHALSSPSTLTTNQWYHLALVSTPSGTTGYCNAVSQGTTAQTITSNSITDYHIGRRSSNAASEFMSGNIALLRVYHNRALSAAEIQQNYEALRDRYGI